MKKERRIFLDQLKEQIEEHEEERRLLFEQIKQQKKNLK